jgi:CheY-like chemotaxis protein
VPHLSTGFQGGTGAEIKEFFNLRLPWKPWRRSFVMKRILVVEDDRLTRYLIKRKLEKRGYEVLTAKNETEFWEHAFNPFIDLILSDLCLENRLGTDIYHALLDFGMDKDIPIIFTTGIVNKNMIGGNMLQDDGHTFLMKPIDFEVLEAEMQKSMNSTLAEKIL